MMSMNYLKYKYFEKAIFLSKEKTKTHLKE